MPAPPDRSTRGRGSRLVDSQQSGSIAADDGREYVFSASALPAVTFAEQSLGTRVTLSPRMTAPTLLRAELVGRKDART